MTARIRSLVGLVTLVSLMLAFAAYRPQAEEISAEEPATVSESDIQTYLNVYKAMQSDHGLSIEDALRPYNLTLDEFRQIERHIQDQPRLVERVRQALTDYAKTNSSFALAAETPTPRPTPTSGRAKKK
jgi:hypothetical protein